MGLMKRNVGQALSPVLLLAAFAAQAQDTKTLVSPNGELKFAVFIAAQKESSLPRIAYTVTYKGRPVLETSYLGFDILDQEPLLGENAGLTSSKIEDGHLTADYMQNGSLGRRIVVEAKITDDSVAFRYTIPKTNALIPLQIADELTEFVEPVPHAAPVFEIPGLARVEITERGNDGNYPKFHLVESGIGPSVLVTNIGKTWEKPAPPVTTPWRVIVIAPLTIGE
jgi:hypothetical protein